MLQRKPTMTREVVGVRVRLEHADEADAAPPGFFEVLLDRVRRVDDDRLPSALVADQVRSAPESVVNELREDHSGAKVPPVSAIALEVSGPAVA